MKANFGPHKTDNSLLRYTQITKLHYSNGEVPASYMKATWIAELDKVAYKMFNGKPESKIAVVSLYNTCRLHLETPGANQTSLMSSDCSSKTIKSKTGGVSRSTIRKIFSYTL